MCVVKSQVNSMDTLSLLDSGSQVSLIVEEVALKAGLGKHIVYRNYPAKSWSEDGLSFTGTVVVKLRIGKFQFRHMFYTCKKLQTQTDLILGLDWLKASQVSMSFNPEHVKMLIGDTPISLEVTPQTISHPQTSKDLQVYTVVPEKEVECVPCIGRVAGFSDRKILPMSGASIPPRPGGRDWPKTAFIEHCEPLAGLEVPSQIMRVTKTAPLKAGNPHRYYAYVVVHNKAPEPRYVHRGLPIGEIEAVWENHTFSKKMATVIKQVVREVTGARTVINERWGSPPSIATVQPDNAEPPHMSEVPIDSGRVSDTAGEITESQRLQRVTHLIDTEFPKMHKLARTLLLEFPQTVHLVDIPFKGVKSIMHKIAYSGPLFFNRQYKTPHILEADVLAEIDRLLRCRIIEASDSPYNNALLPVLKPNGKIRLALDVRSLNRYTPVDRLYLGDFQEVLNRLHGMNYFSTLDCASGFHQMVLHPESRPLTAFRYGNRCFQFKFLLFGLSNGPAAWSRLMQLCLSGLPNVSFYLDDILIYSKTVEEHEQILRQVLDRLKEHGMELSLDKCHFFQSKVKFLGFQVSSEGLRPLQTLVEPLMQAPIPTNLTSLRSLLGSFSFYRRFLKGFAQTAAPLIELTAGHPAKVKGSHIPIECDDRCVAAINTLKEQLNSEVVLRYPDFSRPFALFTDASLEGLGSWLGQEDKEGHMRPVLFLSRSLNKAEKNYPICELESLAIVEALKKCRPFLLGSRVKIYTDARSLIYLFRYCDPSSRLYRWQMAIQEYHIDEIEFIAGKDNIMADWLSRWSYQTDPLTDTPLMTCGVLVPTRSPSILSILYQALPKNFKAHSYSKGSRAKAGDLIVIMGDCRNTTMPHNMTSLEPFTQTLKNLYEQRSPAVSEESFTKCALEECERCRLEYAQTWCHHDHAASEGDISYMQVQEVKVALIHSRVFQRPPKVSLREATIHCLLQQPILQEEKVKVLLKNDTIASRDYNMFIALERLIPHVAKQGISKVFIQWPFEEDSTVRRDEYVRDLLERFAYALFQLKVECWVGWEPKSEEAGTTLVAVAQVEARHPVTSLLPGTHQLLSLGPRDLPAAQIKDPQLALIISGLKMPPSAWHKNYALLEGILCSISSDDTRGTVYRYCIPASMRTDVIRSFHDLNVHPGFIRTYQALSAVCTWPGLKKDVRDHIHSCETCRKAKHSYNMKVLEGHLAIPPRCRHTVAIDVLGSLPKSERFTKILVAVDMVSRYVYAEALPTESAGDIIKALKVMRKLEGWPVIMHTDNAGCFRSGEFQDFLQTYNIKHKLSVPYSPRGNALAEKSVQTVIGYLRILCEDQPRNWSQYLQDAVSSYNNCYHVTLRDSPHFLHFVIDPHLPFNILRGETGTIDKNTQAYIVQYCYELATSHVKQQQLLRARRSMNALQRRQIYDQGDLVYLRAVFINDKAHKLRHPFRGPYRILKLEGNTVKLGALSTGKTRRASMRNLRFYAAESISTAEHPNANEPIPLMIDPDLEDPDLPKDLDGEENVLEREPSKLSKELPNEGLSEIKTSKPGLSKKKVVPSQDSSVKPLDSRRYNLRSRSKGLNLDQ